MRNRQNTPGIIKYPFWQMTNDNKNAVYACLNYSEACCPRQIEGRSIVIDGDSGEVIKQLMQAVGKEVTFPARHLESLARLHEVQ